MWTVGKLRGVHYQPIPGSPRFTTALRAEAWAMSHAEAHPEFLRDGEESLTWRWSPFGAEVVQATPLPEPLAAIPEREPEWAWRSAARPGRPSLFRRVRRWVPSPAT